MEWDKYFRRYVWNDRTTPYFTAVDKLNREQANAEILFYCLFHGVLFAVISISALGGGPDGRSPGLAYYSFSVVIASVIFGMAKSYSAALYLSATPIAGLLYIYLFRTGSPDRAIDTFVVTGVLLLLARYSFRIVGVAREYPNYPPAPPPEDPPTYKPRRRPRA